jgi:hypothetical protein
VPRCRRIKDPANRRRCLRNARRHNQQQHSCKPQPIAITCAGGRCGSALDNCRKPVTCPSCAAGKSCVAENGSCSQSCDIFGPDICPAGCSCSVQPATGGSAQCVPAGAFFPCEQIPQVCTSTAQCPLGSFCGAMTGVCGTNRCVPVCPS